MIILLLFTYYSKVNDNFSFSLSFNRNRAI